MRTALLALTLITTAAAFTGSTAAQSTASVLQGVWDLLPAESEDVDSLDLEAQQKAPRPPRAVRPGAARPAGVPGGFGFPRGFDPQLTRDALDLLRRSPDRLALSFNHDTLTLVAGDAAPYALVTNGRKVKRPWIDGRDAEIKASLRGNELRIERKLENDLKITEQYELNEATGRLIVTTEVDGPMPRRLELRRVFVRAAPGQP